MPPLTIDRASEIGSLPKNRKVKAYYQAIKLQSVVEGMLEKHDLKPTEASSLLRAWVELNGVRRVEAGLGAPKTVPAANDPAIAKPKRKRGIQAEAGESDGPAS